MNKSKAPNVWLNPFDPYRDYPSWALEKQHEGDQEYAPVSEIERLCDQIQQMLNVPEFARNHMKDQTIEERDAEIERLQEKPPYELGQPTVFEHCDGGYVCSYCVDCGPDVAVDEEGCCACGQDAVRYGKRGSRSLISKIERDCGFDESLCGENSDE